MLHSPCLERYEVLYQRRPDCASVPAAAFHEMIDIRQESVSDMYFALPCFTVTVPYLASSSRVGYSQTQWSGIDICFLPRRENACAVGRASRLALVVAIGTPLIWTSSELPTP